MANSIDFDRFPYRRDYIGDAIVKASLDKIFEIKPVIFKQKWEIPNGKIISKIPNFKDMYYLNKTVITSIPNHWEYDKIIDYYSEDARIKTPGYGERYSVYEYWHNPDLRHRWLKSENNQSLEDMRELLYTNIQEARPAYILISKSLYYELINLRQSDDDCKILDIAAYGERAIAAASLKKVSHYDGIDPNYDLIPGHNQIISDLNYMNPECNIRFIHIGLEDYKTSRKYDIVTYSPPPFNTEPYGPGQQSQSYNKYPTFNDYICKFILDIIYKAKDALVDNGIFSLTFLDRTGTTLSNEFKSDNTELIYTELLLLLISSIGFKYIGAIGLAAGGKRAGVPWWTFRLENSDESDAIELIDKYYPNIFSIIANRLIANNPNTSLLNKYKQVKQTDNYIISTFNISTSNNLVLELIRKQVQEYIIETIQYLSGLDYERIRTILGRYLMLRSITGTYECPWDSCLYLDPVFPTKCFNRSLIKDINDTIINYLTEKKVNKDKAIYIVHKYKYWIGSYEAIGIEDLYHYAANYLNSLPLNDVNVIVKHRSDKNSLYNRNKASENIIYIKGNNEFNELIRTIPSKSKPSNVNSARQSHGLPMQSSSVVWEGTVSTSEDKHNIELIAHLRYETLGALGHQYTRSNKRTNIIEKIFNMPIIDIYASIYNNQSEAYCSIYPDVEKGLIGSAFCLKMTKGAYLANPVDIPVFLSKSIDNILLDLEASSTDKLYISMAFTVWTDTEPEFINDFTSGIHYSELFSNSENIGLNKLSKSKFVLATYILDKTKFPSILSGKLSNRESTISVGVLLGNDRDINYEFIEDLVKDSTYIQKSN